MNTNYITEELMSHPLFPKLKDILESGEFIDPEQKLVSVRGDQSLDEMNLLEKALYTLAAQCQIEGRGILENSSLEEGEMFERLRNLKDLGQNALDYLLDSVKAQYPEEFSKSKASGAAGAELVMSTGFRLTLRDIQSGIGNMPDIDAVFEALKKSGILEAAFQLALVEDSCEDCDDTECPGHPHFDPRPSLCELSPEGIFDILKDPEAANQYKFCDDPDCPYHDSEGRVSAEWLPMS